MEDNKNNIKKLIDKLSFEKEILQETLKELYSRLQSQHDITIFRRNNGLKLLIKYLQDDNVNLVELKILLYCCSDHKTKLQILQWKAIPSICNLLKSLKDKESLRVVCKVLGTLCANKLCRIAIHDQLESLTVIIACLHNHPPSDHQFFITHLKTIRSLSRSEDHCGRMVEMGVVRGVCALLKTNLSCSLVKEVLITINHFLKRWSNKMEVQFMEAEGMCTLDLMVRREDSLSGIVFHFILYKLLHKQELIKYFGTTGLLQLLVEKFEKLNLQTDKEKYLRNILILCKDSSNRASAINHTNLLQILITELNQPHSYHKLLLQIIVCFKYNVEANDHLMTNHFIPSCIKLLQQNTCFNLPEMTSQLLYVNTEVGNTVSVNTPVSPSTFTDGYRLKNTNYFIGNKYGYCNTPISSISGRNIQNDGNTVFEASGDHKEHSDSDDFECPNPTPVKTFKLIETTSEEEEEEEDEEDFDDVDHHLYQMARSFEVERRNKYVFNKLSQVVQDMYDGKRCGRQRKTKSTLNIKRIKLHSDFCIKSTLEQMISPLQNTTPPVSDKNTQHHIIDLLNHLLNHPAVEKHLNRVEVLKTLIYNVPASPNNHKLLAIFFKITQNPLYLKLLLSEMLLPMIDIFCKINSDSLSLKTLFLQIKFNLNVVCHSNYAPAILHELLSIQHSRIQCIISLCHLVRKGSKRDYLFSEKEFITDLVSCMYDHQHPLRLLAISSYCYLLDDVEVSCECDLEFEECDIDVREVSEQEYDVCFVVKDECVKSVKSRLMQYSEVFTAMFKGCYTEANSAQIPVTDTSPEAFRFFNQSLMSGHFNGLLFEVDNSDTLLEVFQLANKYLIKQLEGQIVRLICSNLSLYFDAILAKNYFLISRPLFVSCLLHACKRVCIVQKYEMITYLFKFITKDDFTILSNNLIKYSYCIHNV